MTNGWRDGKDPAQRVLRVVTAVVCLAVFIILGIDRTTPVVERLPVIAVAVAALMILLGYERLVRLPGIDRRDDDEVQR